MLSLAWPYALLLLPIPYLWQKLWPAKTAIENPETIKVPFFQSLSTIKIASTVTNQNSNQTQQWLLLLLWLCVLVALARPQWLGDAVSLPISGRELFLAVDVSQSMETPDLSLAGQETTRLHVVKTLADDFLQRREGDKLGLILFGSGAYLQSPLSFDTKATRQFLREAMIGIAGERTAIGDAIALGVKQLQTSEASNRVLVLLTDGSNNAGHITPKRATELAQNFGVTIYTIGIGAHSMTINSILGRHTINPSQDLDEELLRDIAAATNGKYFRAADSKGLAAIYQSIEHLEPIQGNPELFRPITSLYHWPLLLALIVAARLHWQQYRASLQAVFMKRQQQKSSSATAKGAAYD